MLIWLKNQRKVRYRTFQLRFVHLAASDPGSEAPLAAFLVVEDAPSVASLDPPPTDRRLWA